MSASHKRPERVQQNVARSITSLGDVRPRHRAFSAVCKKAMLGVEIWVPKQGEAALRDRLSPRHRELVAFIIAMALCSAASAAPLHAKKGHAHKPLMQQSAPPPVHYIHCAIELGQ